MNCYRKPKEIYSTELDGRTIFPSFYKTHSNLEMILTLRTIKGFIFTNNRQDFREVILFINQNKIITKSYVSKT